MRNVSLGKNAVIGEYVELGVQPKHPTADLTIGDQATIRSHTVIYAGNKIGNNFQTGHGVLIRENNCIGDNVSVGSHTVMERENVIEDHVRIHSMCFIPEFVIIKKDTKEIIGDSGIYFCDNDNKQVELGCTLDKHYQKKGYAAEALVKLINYIFHEMNKHRITASIDPDNINSIRLFERIGFRKEAHFIKSLFINGKWSDNLIYALLKEEWNSKT